MRGYIDANKQAIRDRTAFKGLCVPNPDAVAALFMQPQFHLVDFPQLGQIVFEVYEKSFVFHLVNFTRVKSQGITEAVIDGMVMPFCRAEGLEFIQARVERRGMARKLQRLGFENFSGNVYRRPVNVL